MSAPSRRPARRPARGPGANPAATGARGAPASGRQQQRQTVRTAARRRPASTRWLERQLNDPYVIAAQREGWRSRAAFKLLQINDKVPLLRPGQRILDLGAAPGGWSQVAARTALSAGGGRVVAIDRLPMDPIEGVTILTQDFLDDDAPARLTQALGGPADLVLSDLSPNTVGHAATDHLRIVALVEAAAAFAMEVLRPGGAFVAKVFQGGADSGLMTVLRQRFDKVRHVKPDASRAESAEIYLIAEGFRPI